MYICAIILFIGNLRSLYTRMGMGHKRDARPPGQRRVDDVEYISELEVIEAERSETSALMARIIELQGLMMNSRRTRSACALSDR